MKSLHHFICLSLTLVLLLDLSITGGSPSLYSPSFTQKPPIVVAFKIQAIVGEDITAQFSQPILKPKRHLWLLRQFSAFWRGSFNPFNLFANAVSSDGFILKGEAAQQELLNVIKGQSSFQASPVALDSLESLVDLPGLQQRAAQALDTKRKYPTEEARQKILQAVSDLLTKRKVGFQSIVLGSKHLPDQADQFALGFCMKDEIPTLGYATDLIAYLQLMDEKSAKTRLLEEYLLHEALEAYFDHATSRVLQKLLFPENYRSRMDEGLLRESLRQFIDWRAAGQPVPTAPFQRSVEIPMTTLKETVKELWFEHSHESDLRDHHFDTTVLAQGRISLTIIDRSDARQYLGWYMSPKYVGRRARTFVLADPYRAGKFKWASYLLSEDGEILQELICEHVFDRSASNAFVDYRTVDEENADRVKQQWVEFIQGVPPAPSLAGLTFIDQIKGSVARVWIGTPVLGRQAFAHLSRDYFGRKVQVSAELISHGVLEMVVQPQEPTPLIAPMRFYVDKDVYNFLRPSLTEDERLAGEIKTKILSCANGDISEESLVGLRWRDQTDPIGIIKVGNLPGGKGKYRSIDLTVGKAYPDKRVEIEIIREPQTNRILFKPYLLDETNAHMEEEPPASVMNSQVDQFFSRLPKIKTGNRSRRSRSKRPEIFKPEVRPPTFEDDLALLERKKSISQKVFDGLSMTTRFRLLQLAAQKAGIPLTRLLPAHFVDITLDQLPSKTLSFIQSHYRRIAKKRKWKGSIIDLIRLDLKIPKPSLADDLAHIDKFPGKIEWAQVGDGTQRYLVERVLAKRRRLSWQLSEDDLIAVGIDELHGNPLGGGFIAYWRASMPADYPGGATAFLVEYLQPVSHLTAAEEVAGFAESENLPWRSTTLAARRLLVRLAAAKALRPPHGLSQFLYNTIELDELKGKTLASLYALYSRLRSDKGLPVTAHQLLIADLGLIGPQKYDGGRVSEPTCWQRLEKIIEINGTRRIYVDFDETLVWPDGWVGSEDWLASRGEHLPSVYAELADHERRMLAAGAMIATDPHAADVIKRLQAKGIEIIGLTSRRSHDQGFVKSVLHSMNLELPVIFVHSHAADAKAKRIAKEQESRGTMLTLVVDNEAAWLDAIEEAQIPDVKVAYYESNRHDRWKDPVYYLERAERRLTGGQAALAHEDLINAVELLRSQDLPEEARLVILDQAGNMIRRLQTTDVDVAPALQAFLREGARVLAARNGNVSPSSDALDAFLPVFFSFYFPNNGDHMVQYYRDGLIRFRQRQAIAGEEFYIALDETNLFPFLEPILRAILHEKPDKIVLLDTGARPMAWAIQAFCEAMGLATQVVLLPLSIKTKGDTLKSTQHWMDLGKDLAEGRLALNAVQEGAREAVVAFSKLFPLQDQSVLLVDDNFVAGDTLDVARRALAAAGVLRLSAASIWGMRDGKVDRSEVLQTYQVKGRFNWYHRSLPVTLRTVWETNTSLRGVKRQRSFSGNPLAEPLPEEDPRYTAHVDFKTRLIETFRNHIAQYVAFLDSTVPLPILHEQGKISGEPDVTTQLKMYDTRPPITPLFPEFTLTVGDKTLTCRPIKTPEELRQYVTRPGARPADAYADQLQYPDLTAYRIYDTNDHPIGSFELLKASPASSAFKQTALVIDYIDLDYGSNLNLHSFADALLPNVSQIAEHYGLDWVLIPRLDWMIAGRPEITAAILENREMQWAPVLDEIAYPAESASFRQHLRANSAEAVETIRERLSIFMEGKSLAEASQAIREQFQTKMADWNQTGQADPAMANLLRFRFRSLSRWPFRILWRRVTAKQKRDLDPFHRRLAAISPYLFDSDEQGDTASLTRALDLGIHPRPWQMSFLEQLERRAQFFEDDRSEIQGWQQPFLSKRDQLSSWSSADKLAFQALEYYSRKVATAEEEERPRYPDNFFEGEIGQVRATAITKFVVFQKNGIYDLRELKPKFFYEQNLEAIWERAFSRNLLNVARALYPGQYHMQDEKLQPLPLTPEDLLRWQYGMLDLAPGRFMNHESENAKVLVHAEGLNDQPYFIGSVRSPERAARYSGPVILASLRDTTLGRGMGIFMPESYERWNKGDLTAVPLSVYFWSELKDAPAHTPQPFALYAYAMKEGRHVQRPPVGSPWLFAAAKLFIKENLAGNAGGVVTYSLQPHGLPLLTFSVSPESVKTHDLKNGDPVVAAMIQDPNHGLVAQVFKEQDFDASHPERSVRPLTTYMFSHGKWVQADLAILDILAFDRGEKNMIVMDRSWKGTPSRDERNTSGVIIGVNIGDYLERASFNFTAGETEKWDLLHTPLEFRLNFDEALGPFVEIWMEKRGTRQLLGTNFHYRNYSNRIDINRIRLVTHARGELGINGHPVEPKEAYFHDATISEQGSLHFRLRGDFSIYFPEWSWPALVGKKPVFIPERNLQHGWIIKVHDTEAYLANKQRSPDIILVRDPQKGSLVPLEDFQNRTITAEERTRFESMVNLSNVDRLLKLGSRAGPLLYRYLSNKFPGQFSLGKIPILLQDWMGRITSTNKLVGGAGGSQQTRPKKPTHPQESQDISIQPESSEETVKDLSSILHKTTYQDLLHDQEGAMAGLRTQASEHPESEWRAAYQRIHDYFKGIFATELPEFKPIARLMAKLFQLEGIRFLIDHPEGALWDDPGLGKTFQALGAALHIPRRDPTRANLITSVVPGSGIAVWRSELKKWARYPHDVIVMETGKMATLYRGPDDIKGTRLPLREALARYETSPPQHSPLVLVTYDTLKGSFFRLWTYLQTLQKSNPAIPANLFGSFGDFSATYQQYGPDWSEDRVMTLLEEKLRAHLNADELDGLRQSLSTEVHVAYGTFEAMRSLKSDIVIVDEAHKLRNEDTLQAQALSMITAPHKIMLSGRPLLSRDRAKLFPMLYWLSPSRFSSLAEFNRRYPNTLDGRMRLWIDMQGLSLRRRKREVLLPGELPPIHYHEVQVTLNSADTLTYQTMEGEFREWLDAEVARTGHLPSSDHIFSKLMSLMQFTSGLRYVGGKWVFDENNPKVKELDAIVAAKIAKGEKVLIFSQFVPVAEALRERYAKHGIVYLAGKVSNKKREREIQKFQEDADTMICVSTYGTGGETVTLTAANNVVLYDLEYDVPEQPIDRIDRLGQTREMHVYSLIAKDTFDMNLLILHSQKQDVFDQVVEGFFSPEQIMAEITAALAATMGASAAMEAGSAIHEMLEAFLARQNGHTTILESRERKAA